MGNQFAKLLFTDAVKEVQALMGSRKSYARLEQGPVTNQNLTSDEAEFIAQRNSFYLASISESGWPYIQHRGGPTGFLRILSDREIGFADYSGNRQYVTVGNLSKDSRVALIMVDYPNRARLKLLGTARLIDENTDPSTLNLLKPEGYAANVERGFVIRVEAYDWNCPQHITPRWEAADIGEVVGPLKTRIQELEEEIARLRKVAER